jgi:molecular chaperone IbpA
MVVKDNTLVVSGKVANDGQKGEVLYRGIAGRAFERRFVLAYSASITTSSARQLG